MQKRPRLPESVAPDHTTKRSVRRTDYNLEDCLAFIGGSIALSVIILCVLMLGGCTTTKVVYVPTETASVRTDSAYRSVYIDRLIIERDTVNTYTKGDTVFREVTKWRVREVAKTDTVFRSKTDSVYVEKPYPVEVVKEVERKLKWWQTALIWIGVVSLIGICIAVWWMVRKRK